MERESVLNSVERQKLQSNVRLWLMKNQHKESVEIMSSPIRELNLYLDCCIYTALLDIQTHGPVKQSHGLCPNVRAICPGVIDYSHVDNRNYVSLRLKELAVATGFKPDRNPAYWFCGHKEYQRSYLWRDKSRLALVAKMIDYLEIQLSVQLVKVFEEQTTWLDRAQQAVVGMYDSIMGHQKWRLRS